MGHLAPTPINAHTTAPLPPEQQRVERQRGVRGHLATVAGNAHRTQPLDVENILLHGNIDIDKIKELITNVKYRSETIKLLPSLYAKGIITKQQLDELTKMSAVHYKNETPYIKVPEETQTKKQIELKRKYKYKTPTQTYRNYIY